MDLFEHGAPQNSMVLSMIFSFLHCPEKKTNTWGVLHVLHIPYVCTRGHHIFSNHLKSSSSGSLHSWTKSWYCSSFAVFFFSRVNVHMWNPPWFPLGTSPLGLCNTPVHDGNDEDDGFEMTSWMSSPKTPMLARLAKVGCHVLMFIEAT